MSLFTENWEIRNNQESFKKGLKTDIRSFTIPEINFLVNLQHFWFCKSLIVELMANFIMTS